MTSKELKKRSQNRSAKRKKEREEKVVGEDEKEEVGTEENRYNISPKIFYQFKSISLSKI